NVQLFIMASFIYQLEYRSPGNYAQLPFFKCKFNLSLTINQHVIKALITTISIFKY
uniref:Uncharacterized protein n=1 Tax=Gallus gallus TaxID=9031 RepID=A0A8V0Z9K5_CHICK